MPNPSQPAQSDDPLAQLSQAEQSDQQGLTRLVGEHAATQEVQANAQRIASTPKPTSIPDDNVKQTIAELGHNTVQVGEGIYSGVVHAAGELASSAASLATINTPQMIWEAIANHSPDADMRGTAGRNADRLKAVQAGIRGVADAITPTIDSTSGDLAKGAAQFVAAFLPISRVASAAEGANVALRIGSSAVAAGTTQAAAFNPDDGRLSNLIQQFPVLQNPVTEYLASKPGDTEADGRFKNFLEGTGLGIVGDAVLEGGQSLIGQFSNIVKGMRASKSIAENTKAVAEAAPTPIDHPSPQAEPAATATETTQAATSVEPSATPNEPVTPTQGAPKADAQATPDIATQSPGDPNGIVKADSATPKAAPEATFSAAEAARSAISISSDQASNFLQALKDGEYSKIPNMLDDTHRTIPWDKLSDGANLQEMFNAMEGHFGSMIKQAHGTGPVPDATIVQLAKDIGGDPTQLAATFNNVTSNGGLAAQITAGYNMMVASARRLKDLAEVARPLAVGSPEGQRAILEFQKQLELHAAIVGQVRQSSSEIGRALYAHRSLKASSDVLLQNVSELAGTTLGPKAITKFLEGAGKAGDNLADLNSLADKVRGNGLVGVIKEIAQNGMLSGITTQLANLGGNAANALIKTSERYLAGVIGQVRGVLMPDAETATIRAAVAHTAGSIKGIQDAFPLFVKALIREPDVSASGLPAQRAIFKATDGLDGADLSLARVINVTGQVVRYPGRFMGAVDNLNMGIGYQGDLAARTYTQAASEADAKGLKGDARSTFMDQRQAELRDNPPDDVKEKALDAGLYQSFQEAARTRFGEGISNLLNSHPIVKLLIAPFVHRPLNMLRQSLMDYTALGLTSQSQRALLGAANADSDLAIARMTIGTSALAYSYNLASNGITTGAGLGSRNTQTLDGIPMDSIKIGDKWHQYNRVDPIGLWLSIGADLHQHIVSHYDPNNPDSTSDLTTLARMGVQTLGAAAMDKSFMASIDQVMQSLSEKDPAKAEQLVQRLLASNAGKFVPFSGALRTIAQEQDPTMRATGGDGLANLWDTVKKNLPGLSQDLPPKRDILGRPVARPGDGEGWWNPFAGTTAATAPMDQELSKLAVNVKTPPRQLDGVVLDAKTYDELITRSTEAKVFPGGTNLRDYLGELTSSPQWKRYYTTPDNGVMVHTEMVQRAVDAAYSYGKQAFLQAHSDFTQMEVAKVMQRSKNAQPAAQQTSQIE